MAYKRHIDRLPIIPADAKKHNVTCHYCIVGCGYHAYTWPVNKQGGTAPDRNAFGVDLSEQQYADTEAWYSPSMYNIVRQDGKDVHLVIKPDHGCVVNSGLGSVRGARMAENRRSDKTGTQQQRLTEPMVWRYGTWQPTSWADALDLVARVTARVIDKDDENDLFVSMFDHGGSAGGYENTWGTGKLYFGSMKVKNCRIHNRPAYNSEVHATRDMGIDELNYAYEDYTLTDTIMLVGTNPLECQTNLFLNHMVPGMRNGAKVIIVDPRRTVTANACEVEAGAENVLHLAIKTGTDLALFNTLFTYIADQGWVDKDFIAASTLQGDVAVPQDEAHPAALGSFEMAREKCKMSLAEGASITGLAEADIVKAAEWIAKPKEDGSRRKCTTGYEKGIIWGNDNYRVIGALVNIGLKQDTSFARSKSWDEFAGPDAPTMDFVFTVCDNAANEACPVWPGQPMTAHWGVPDPAAVEGTDAEKHLAFAEAYRQLSNRLSAFLALPLTSIDRMSLQTKLRDIGQDRSMAG
ncbi:arsenate reductase (azurin) large subunit [Nitratireductor sp. ZSWI3]|nr:arsenate reductase (azurin) large subunit [Nitratireductor sp. ZSWI3]MCR4269157.1 arsenate reductase (azurin) large subunit [Nitratireductor sp. ZSWI3]